MLKCDAKQRIWDALQAEIASERRRRPANPPTEADIAEYLEELLDWFTAGATVELANTPPHDD